MTNNEKIINIAGLTYTLRDLLEDSEFDREFKMRVNKIHRFTQIMVTNERKYCNQIRRGKIAPTKVYQKAMR